MTDSAQSCVMHREPLAYQTAPHRSERMPRKARDCSARPALLGVFPPALLSLEGGSVLQGRQAKLRKPHPAPRRASAQTWAAFFGACSGPPVPPGGSPRQQCSALRLLLTAL